MHDTISHYLGVDFFDKIIALWGSSYHVFLWAGMYAGGDYATISYERLTALANLLRYEPEKIKQDIEALKKIMGK